MAKIIASNKSRIVVAFSEPALRKYGKVTAYAFKYYNRIFVNWNLPLITWGRQDLRCAEDILDLIRKVANWQARLQDKNTRFNAHSHKPTIRRDNGLTDQKIRIPVFAKESAPFVQWVRDENGSQWLVHGYTFNDDIPSAVAYYAALRTLVDMWREMNNYKERGE